MDPGPHTPRKIWAAHLLWVLAIVVWLGGYWRSQALTGDFQPVAFLLISLGWGVVCSVAGIVCTLMGAHRTPRSLPTRIAIVLAGIFSTAAAGVATFLVRLLFTE
jgi:hypothetical protein